jgi:hypothetical protein
MRTRLFVPGLLVTIGALLCPAPPCSAVSADPERFATPPPVPRFAPPATGVLFADDFSGRLGKWTADRDSVWSVWRGMLRADLPDQKQLRSFLYAGSEEWRDYALDFDVCMMRGVDKGAIVRVQGETGVGVDLRGGTYQDVVMYLREWPLGKASANNAGGAWQHVRIEVLGPRFRVIVNGQLRLDRTDARRAQGRIALAAYTGGLGQCTVYYDNVVVTALQ